MKKLNTKGFSLLEGLIVLVVISAVVGLGFYAKNRMDNKSSSAESVSVKPLSEAKKDDLKKSRSENARNSESVASANNVKPEPRWKVDQKTKINGKEEFIISNYFDTLSLDFYVSDPNNVNKKANYFNDLNTDEAIGFYAYPLGSGQGQKVYSLRKTVSSVRRSDSKVSYVNSVYYTTSEQERKNMLNNGFSEVNYDTIVDFNAFPNKVDGTVEVYRLSKSVTRKNDKIYIYTDTKFEKDLYLKKGYKDDGVAFYAPARPFNFYK